MASKRDLKRQVKYMIYDVIDECYFISGTTDGKEEAAEKCIDGAVAFHEDILPQINKAKSKAEFKTVIEQIEKKQVEFVKELNALN